MMNNIQEILNPESKEFQCDYKFPNYIHSRYEISFTSIIGIRVFLVKPKIKLDPVNKLKKHFNVLKKQENVPVILVLNRISYRERERYIQANIPFVVKGKQCYLPFVGTLLSSRCDAEVEPVDKFKPSSQKVLFYLIYSGKERISMQEVVTNLDFSAMTVTRALKELEKAQLIKTEKKGVEKIIKLEYNGKEVFHKAKPHLINPIKRKQYSLKEDLPDDRVIAGDTVLEKFSMLNLLSLDCYAVQDNMKLREAKDNILIDETVQVELQIWKYAPCTFSRMNIDPLSVLLSYDNNSDERVEEALEDMMNEFWRLLYDEGVSEF